VSCWRNLALIPILWACASCGRGSCEPDAAGVCVTVKPDAGSGPLQLFEVNLSGGGAADRIGAVRVLINGIRDGAHACYIYYVLPQKSFLLVADTGSGATALTGGSVANSQCRLDAAGTSASVEKDTVRVRLNVAFDPRFYGEKQVFVAYDSRDGRPTDLRSVGSWWVP
jgi:hypothetical protein